MSRHVNNRLFSFFEMFKDMIYKRKRFSSKINVSIKRRKI